MAKLLYYYQIHTATFTSPEATKPVGRLCFM